MYDNNFRNQAVKEYFNGNSLSKTAKKFGISHTALKDWVNDYREKIANISNNLDGSIYDSPISEGFAQKDRGVDNYDQQNQSLTILPHDEEEHEMELQLKSVNVNIDGQEITISKNDVKKLMEIFHQFDE